MRKEAGAWGFIKNIFKGKPKPGTTGAGVSGEGRHSAMSSLMGGPEMVPATVIGGGGIALTES